MFQLIRHYLELLHLSPCFFLYNFQFILSVESLSMFYFSTYLDSYIILSKTLKGQKQVRRFVALQFAKTLQ